MSTDEEIQEVYEQDIRDKTKIVYNKQVIQAFLDQEGIQSKNLYDGLVTSDDRELLQRILDNDSDDFFCFAREILKLRVKADGDIE